MQRLSHVLLEDLGGAAELPLAHLPRHQRRGFERPREVGRPHPDECRIEVAGELVVAAENANLRPLRIV